MSFAQVYRKKGRLTPPFICGEAALYLTQFTQTTMDSTTISKIFSLIEQADCAREEALLPENEKNKGWPYVCGYQQATLKDIREILEGAR